MKKSKFRVIILGTAVIAALLVLTACSSQEVIKEVEVTRVVEKPVEVTRVVEAETGAAGPAQPVLAVYTTPFEEWRQHWQRMAKTGSLKSEFEVIVEKTYEATGSRIIDPEPGDLLVYENTGNQNWGPVTRPNEENTNEYSRVNVIDARTKELLGTMEMTDKAGFNHTSAVSPDGRYAYVVGGGSYGNPEEAVVWKVDALTLQPLKRLDLGGTVHHMQVFQDKYMLVDTFSTEEKLGRTRVVFLLDPNTDQIVGGVRSEDLGGRIYTAWGGPEQEYIYLLMEPMEVTGTSAALHQGMLGSGAPFWVAKLDPDTWEVVQEYPYPAYRSNWIQFSADGKYMYVDGTLDDSVVKIDLETGEMVWRADVGTGPYAIEVTADDKEVWVTDKGESWKRHKGRTITVVDAETGEYMDTIVYGGRGVDHLILSPDGKEIWASANDSGTVYVIDVATHQTIAEIPMPQFGDPHGLVFVYYDQDGKARVVADQGDFHGGIDPRNGRALD